MPVRPYVHISDTTWTPNAPRNTFYFFSIWFLTNPLSSLQGPYAESQLAAPLYGPQHVAGLLHVIADGHDGQHVAVYGRRHVAELAGGSGLFSGARQSTQQGQHGCQELPTQLHARQAAVQVEARNAALEVLVHHAALEV